MGKNSKRTSAEQLQAHRRKMEQERLAKQKKQDQILLFVFCGILAAALIIAGVAIIVSNVKKKAEERKNTPIELGEPIVDATDNAYAASSEATDLVRLTVQYVDKDLQYRQGEIIVQLSPEHAPITVANFKKLVGEGFYNNLTFHRIIAGFMIQGGDPKGNGTGGSPETIKGEFSANGVANPISHKRGVISMARTSYDSASSQFFIMHADDTGLDGQYAAFGEVVSGMSTVDGIASTPTKLGSDGKLSSPINPVTLVKAEFVTKVG